MATSIGEKLWNIKEFWVFALFLILKTEQKKKKIRERTTQSRVVAKKKKTLFQNWNHKDLPFLCFCEDPWSFFLLLSLFGSAILQVSFSFTIFIMGQLPIRLVFLVDEKVGFFLEILEYPFGDFGFFGLKGFNFVQLLQKFLLGWSKVREVFFNWCGFWFSVWRRFVGFIGELRIFHRFGFLHCFDSCSSWIFLGRKHVLLIELLMF